MLYYICEHGEAKAKAEEYRSAYERLRGELFAVAARFGAKEAIICDEMMLLRGIKITGDIPSGWSTPSWLHGCARPKRIKANADILRHFTPHGSYCIEMHRELRPFFDWLAFPRRYAYTTADGTGWSGIWSGIHGIQPEWFAIDSPVGIALRDLAAIKAKAIANGETPSDSALDWVPPAGMRLSSKEEWDYLKARHAFEKAGGRP